MPNWCWNSLTIEGNKESISKFRKILNTPDRTELLCKSEDKENLRKEYLKEEKKRGNHTEDIITFVNSQTKDINEFIINEYRIKSGLDIKVIQNGDVVSFVKNGMLNLFHPMPTELLGTTSPSRESNADLIAKYGVDNWYDWHCNNWGTKWDVDVQDNGYDSSEDEEYINLSFESAWSPPTEWLNKVAQDYPSLKFLLEYEECGCAFKGTLEICEDEGVFEDKCWDWNGDCGECETDYTEEGHCKCEDDNGKKLVWGEEVDSEEEENPCAV
jgi:hypothetical protein